jgi:hypothetical protein
VENNLKDRYIILIGVILLSLVMLWAKYDPWGQTKEYQCLVTHKYESVGKYDSHCYLVYKKLDGKLDETEVSIARYVTAKENAYVTFFWNDYQSDKAPWYAYFLDFFIKVFATAAGITLIVVTCFCKLVNIK